MDAENCVIEIVEDGEGHRERKGKASIHVDSLINKRVTNSNPKWGIVRNKIRSLIPKSRWSGKFEVETVKFLPQILSQELIKTDTPDMNNTTGSSPSIFNVPEKVQLLHSKKRKEKVQLLVPIGPYHSPDLRTNALISVRKKWICARYLINFFGLNFVACFARIEKEEAVVRSYYAQHLDLVYTGGVFKELFFLDSCFIWFFIYMVGCGFQSRMKTVGGNTKKLMMLKNEMDRQVLPDITSKENQIKIELLMLGNQIPWFLIEIINDSLHNSTMDPLRSTLICFENIYPRIQNCGDDFRSKDNQPKKGFQHLLHIYHWSLVPKSIDNQISPLYQLYRKAGNAFNRFAIKINRTWYICFPRRKKGKHSETSSPGENQLIFSSNSDDNESIDSSKLETSLCVPNAVELHESSTSFRRLWGSFEIIFHVLMIWPSARMKISALHIFDYSSTIFTNLINFEQKYQECGFHITGYMTCIVRLLQTKEDVTLLRKNNILPNTMKKDTEILNFVQQMRVETRGARVPGELINFYRRVTKFHGGKLNRAYGGFKHHYCPNPWITLSVFGGVSLFILTLLQTIYTIRSYKKS